MTSHPQAPVSTALALGSQPPLGSAEEQARVKVKMEKKERKHERLRFFFGWCEGCRAFGEGF